MSTLTTTRNYADGTDLTEAQLDAALDSIETWANGSVDSTNIAASGVGTTQLAASAVTASKLATDAVTTAKILDGAVTGAKLDTTAADASTLEVSGGSMRIKDLGVTTAKINTGAVTQAKRAALGQQVSSSSGAYTSTSTSFTAVTNLSATLTTTGRPVWVGLVSDGGGSNSYLYASNNGAGGGGAATANFQIKQDSTVIANTKISTTVGANVSGVEVPSGSIWHIYVPSAGTYTFTLEGKAVNPTFGAVTFGVYQAKLVAYEL